MQWILVAVRSPQLRRAGVAVAITGAAAAVAAGVVFAERREADRATAIGANAAVDGERGVARSGQHARTRSPKEADRATPGPWVRRAHADATADSGDAGPAVASDGSLPDAAEALRGVADERTDASPTF